MRIVFLVLALATAAAAQLPEDAGPFLVGQRSLTVTHPLSANSTVPAEIYYPATAAGFDTPADASGGPFPLVAFLHGYFANASFYDDLSTHLASYGFVVIATQTESGFFMNIQNEADDSRALLNWAEDRNVDASSFLFGMLDGGDWGIYGHSNGGAGSLLVASVEPRISTIGLLEPNYTGGAPAINVGWPGDLLVVGAELDIIAPMIPNARRYYTEALGVRRKTWIEIQGGGHNGSLDFSSDFVPLPYAEQHRMHRRAVAAFFRAQFQDDEDAYRDLMGEQAPGNPYAHEAVCNDPLLWAVESTTQPNSFALGMTGIANEIGALAYSLSTVNVPTVFGPLGLNPVGLQVVTAGLFPAEGRLEVLLPLPTGLTGTPVWFQGLRLAGPGDGALTRTAAYVLP